MVEKVEKARRLLTVASTQIGPMTMDKEKNLSIAMELLDKAAEEKPNLVVFPEMFTTPYFPGPSPPRPEYFEWAEPIPGPTTDKVGKKAKKFGCYVIAPIFERGRVEGEYFNSAALIGPDGRLVYGTLPNGTRVHCYRKNHLGQGYIENTAINERIYFKPGFGFPVFKTKIATIGILICYDRWFPEAWRMLSLQGADIIVVSTATPCYNTESYYHYNTESFRRAMRTWAQENELFAVGSTRAGVEKYPLEKREMRYSGLSNIIDPGGKLIKETPEVEEAAVISATIDLDEIARMRRMFPRYRDRRPEIYGLISHLEL